METFDISFQYFNPWIPTAGVTVKTCDKNSNKNPGLAMNFCHPFNVSFISVMIHILLKSVAGRKYWNASRNSSPGYTNKMAKMFAVSGLLRGQDGKYAAQRPGHLIYCLEIKLLNLTLWHLKMTLDDGWKHISNKAPSIFSRQKIFSTSTFESILVNVRNLVLHETSRKVVEENRPGYTKIWTKK